MSSQREILVIKVLVNHTIHAILAMVAILLRAVVPDGLLILDHNLEDIGCLALSDHEVEAAEEACAVRQGLAGLAEGGLRDGVVAREEVPFDDVADLCDHVVGVEAETAEAGDDGVGYACEVDGSRGGRADGVCGCC